MNEADVIEREPHLLCNGKPRLFVRERRPRPPYRCIVTRERLHQRVTAERFALVGRDDDGVTALGELANDRLKNSQVREMQRRKNYFHLRAITRRFLP